MRALESFKNMERKVNFIDEDDVMVDDYSEEEELSGSAMQSNISALISN